MLDILNFLNNHQDLNQISKDFGIKQYSYGVKKFIKMLRKLEH